MATSLNAQFELPCPQCMGFNSDKNDSICCNSCSNWFHKGCTTLSKKRLNDIEVHNLPYTCEFCKRIKACSKCLQQDKNPSNCLYCVTCLKNICDDCNSCSSDQICLYRSTDTPFYCDHCNALYPCKVCEKQCYNDSINQPSIFCDKCLSWIHFKCSKLTIRQFNKYGRSPEEPFYCNMCINESLPLTSISNS